MMARAAMLPALAVAVTGIEFIAGTPDPKVFALLLVAALLNAAVRALLPGGRQGDSA